MNWTCTTEPIWNLFGNPLISSLMTMMTHIDPLDSVSVPLQGPAAVGDVLMRLSSPSPAEGLSRLRQGETCGWTQSSTSMLEAPRQRQVLGDAQCKPTVYRICFFFYFFKDGASFLYLCNRKFPNSSVTAVFIWFMKLLQSSRTV